MEVNSTLVGAKLNQIDKKPDVVRLVFEMPKTGEHYIVRFNGLLFETSGSALNRRVKTIRLKDTVGIRAMIQLRHLNRNPQNYRQLYIQMEGSSDENKLELLGAVRTLKISQKRQSNPKKTTTKARKKTS